MRARPALALAVAALLAASAASGEDRRAAQALEFALQSVKLRPGFTPAAVIGARILAADGKIARLVANPSSRLGELLDPLVDRIYMVTVPVGMALAGMVPWWLVAVLLGRDLVLAAALPVVRSRGVTALPVTYVGKGATFALMSGFPLILLGHCDFGWSGAVAAVGWAFIIWGAYMYLWSAVLYLLQVRMVVREPLRTRA